MAVSIYGNSGSLSVGSAVFVDIKLTIPAFDGVYSDGVNSYTVVSGVVTAVTPC